MFQSRVHEMLAILVCVDGEEEEERERCEGLGEEDAEAVSDIIKQASSKPGRPRRKRVKKS